METLAQPKPQMRSLEDTFDWMSERYAAQTRAVSWRGYPVWLHRVANIIAAHHPRTLVDIGCGPGELLRILGQQLPDCQLTGLDPSSAMLDHLSSQVRPYHDKLENFSRGHQAEFDSAVMTFVLRDLHEPQTALKQAVHLLKSGGQLVILETHTPHGWKASGFRIYFHHLLPWWGDIRLTRDWPGSGHDAPYRWLSRTHQVWDRGEALPDWMNDAGLTKIQRHSNPREVIMIWSGQLRT
jgi:demethylmenaquinone methyltransferase/2-methoxy-6-polyprenyl-1,4-benzoquinol methylase